MRTYSHRAAAFDRAPQFVLGTVPIAVYDGGNDGDFDLTNIRRPLLFPDGRMLVSLVFGKGRLMLFTAEGKPSRVVAGYGEGPGDVRSPIDPIALSPDTALVIDANNSRANFVTADGGIVRSTPLKNTINPFCFQNAALVHGGKLLASNGCLVARVDKPSRPLVEVVVMGLDFGAPDTVVRLPGFEMAPFETNYGGRKATEAMAVRFGKSLRIAPWGSGFVTANGEGGYVLEQRAVDGRVTARIRVEELRRVVTPAMRAAQIQKELDRVSGSQSEGMIDPEETRRNIREMPYADSLPPYDFLYPAPGEILWVTDFATLADSTWSATAFRADGAIVARLTVPLKRGTPVAFGEGTVLLRLVDADGVVRFGVYRVVGLEE